MPGTKDEKDESESESDSESGKTKDRRPKKPLTEYEKKRQKIEETKKSLPVFPFREQLLEAIAEHQVKISLKNKFIRSLIFYVIWHYDGALEWQQE